jgi:hypothetical protein
MLARFLPVDLEGVNDRGLTERPVRPALLEVHAQNALPVLVRAVATGVTCVHGVGAAASHTWLGGQPGGEGDKARPALRLLEAATRALCGLVVGVLCHEQGRVGVAAGAPMHARWRRVLSVLLAAYAVLFWPVAHLAEVRLCDAASAFALSGAELVGQNLQSPEVESRSLSFSQSAFCIISNAAALFLAL